MVSDSLRDFEVASPPNADESEEGEGEDGDEREDGDEGEEDEETEENDGHIEQESACSNDSCSRHSSEESKESAIQSMHSSRDNA